MFFLHAKPTRKQWWNQADLPVQMEQQHGWGRMEHHETGSGYTGHRCLIFLGQLIEKCVVVPRRSNMIEYTIFNTAPVSSKHGFFPVADVTDQGTWFFYIFRRQLVRINGGILHAMDIGQVATSMASGDKVLVRDGSSRVWYHGYASSWFPLKHLAFSLISRGWKKHQLHSIATSKSSWTIFNHLKSS